MPTARESLDYKYSMCDPKVNLLSIISPRQGQRNEILSGGDSIKGRSRNFQNLCMCSSEVAYCKAWVLVKRSVEILNKILKKQNE